MKVTFLKPFGVKITGLDLNNDKDVGKLPDLLYHHGLIFLPAGSAVEGAPALHTKPSLCKIGDLYGKPQTSYEVDVFVKKGAAILSQRTGGDTGVNPDSYIYHSDNSWWKRPTGVGILSCVHQPPVGGNTSFQSANEMYKRLSPRNRAFALANRFVHSFHFSYGQSGRPEISEKLPEGQAEHPGVIKHYVTGQPLCYINESNIICVAGMSMEESKPLLEELYKDMYTDDLTYEHNWDVDDVIIWDNIGLQHRAANDYTDLRVMYRVLIMNDYKQLVAYNPEDEEDSVKKQLLCAEPTN